MEQLSLFLAFGAGLLSFISPCSLPLYPAFLSYITGVSINDLKEEKGILRRKAFIHTILFLVGLSRFAKTTWGYFDGVFWFSSNRGS